MHRTGRGGQYTYHGPGQRVAYVMLDLTRRRRDARAYVCGLESWLIATLADFGVTGERREARVGVWVKRPGKPRGPDGEIAEDKIAAIGVRLRQWVSFHGIALNVAPDLSHFGGITPCGVRERHLGVTSLADLGRDRDLSEVDAALQPPFRADLRASTALSGLTRYSVAAMPKPSTPASSPGSLPAPRAGCRRALAAGPRRAASMKAATAGLGPGDHRFDRAVGAIARPAVESRAHWPRGSGKRESRRPAPGR